MKKKQFKSESKKLLNLMINSIYTNKDIFLRELISNASDAIDKLHYLSLTDKSIKLPKDLEISLSYDKDKKTITISDNGIGMTQEELENNLGTIAESDSSNFKDITKNKDTNIIGQFGVGFYSTFMVASKVDVISKSYKDEQAHIWSSEGIEGYTIGDTSKDAIGTSITITLKDDDDDFKYSDYLDEYKIKQLINKYSNYINYPITMMVTKKELKEGTKDEYIENEEKETLNEMTPIWKKSKSKVKDEDYESFYIDKFNDYEKPLDIIKYKAEGLCSFDSLLFIPSHAPYNYFTKAYEKGLKLYSNGVLIMDNCSDLLPDHFSFIKGIVDSEDLSLNISREMLQQDKQLKLIGKNIEKKVNKELLEMLTNNREKYDKFFKEFGVQIKVGIYNSFGSLKEELQDLLMFYSSSEKKLVTLKEYTERMKDNQDSIYFSVGESTDKIELLPQVESVIEKGFEVLYLTEYADEFVLQVMQDYNEKKFTNVENNELDLSNEEEKIELDKLNDDNKDLLASIKDALKDKVSNVKFTNNLKNHPVCLTSEGTITNSMEKLINAMPNEEKVNSSKVLIINAKHPIVKKLENIYKENKENVNDYAKVLYAEARLIEGLSIDNPNEVSDLICSLLAK